MGGDFGEPKIARKILLETGLSLVMSKREKNGHFAYEMTSKSATRRGLSTNQESFCWLVFVCAPGRSPFSLRRKIIQALGVQLRGKTLRFGHKYNMDPMGYMYISNPINCSGEAFFLSNGFIPFLPGSLANFKGSTNLLLYSDGVSTKR